jgi:hypothetical protein
VAEAQDLRRREIEECRNMTTHPKGKSEKSGKERKMPIPAKRQSFEKALEAVNKQYAETLARLAR